MTIANTFASKLAVAFVAIAMMITLAAPAQAATEDELQAQIDALMATINALQSQLGQGGDSMTSSASVCPYAWTRSLSSGSTGMDVMKLQQFLNADAATMVAATGAGSAGNETEYYGPATAAAVSAFQVANRDTVLTPVGLVNGTGYFGPSTMAAANAQCAAAPVMDDSDDTMDDSDDSSDDSDVTLSGEASLDNFDIDGADDDTFEEGAEDAPVLEATIEFTDGDASISRMDVQLIGSGDEQDPWDTFETVSLWVDGDKIAEMDADSKSDYLGDEDNGFLRFSGLDLVAMEDEEVVVTAAVSVQGSVDGVSDGEAWTATIENVRFTDGDGVTSTVVDGDTDADELGNTESFTIEEAGADDEIIVKTSSDDVDATTLQLVDDSKSDWYNVFTFDLDTDDSVSDISLNEVVVTVALSSSTYNAIVDDAELVINGTTISDVTVASGGTATAVLTFNVDGDVVIDAGDRVAAELMLRFESLDTGNEGMTVTGSVSSTNANNIDAEGADDLANTPTDQLRGSATGDTHTLRTMGVDVSVVSTDADVTVSDGNTNDYAVYTIEFDVTAFEQDVFVSTAAATSITYTLEDSAGSSTQTGTRTVSLSSDGDESGSYFEISEGETDTLTLEVTYIPGVAGVAARLQLETLEFAATATTPDQSWTASPDQDFRTATKTIVN